MALRAPAPPRLRIRPGQAVVEVIVDGSGVVVIVAADTPWLIIANAVGHPPEQRLAEMAPIPARLRVGAPSPALLVVVDRVVVKSGPVEVRAVSITSADIGAGVAGCRPTARVSF